MGDNEQKVNIEVSNFGPIGNARVELRPLTVFIGPSNTGKSYLAILIYALHNALYRNFSPMPRRLLGHRRAGRESAPSGESVSADEDQLSDDVIQELKIWFAERASRGRVRGETAERASELPAKSVQAIRSAMSGSHSHFSDETAGLVLRAFGLAEELAPLVRYEADSPANVVIGSRTHDQTSATSTFVQRFAFDRHSHSFRTDAPAEIPLPSLADFVGGMPRFLLDVMDTPDEDEDADRAWALELVHMLARRAMGSLSGHLSRPAYFLPADRTGVMHAHNVVVGALLDSAPYAGIRERRSNAVMTGVLADFLREMMDMGELQSSGRRENSGRVAAEIEDSVLRGAVQSELTEAGHPTFSFQPREWDAPLPLTRTSSMVSELAPVVMYLRHLVAPGDTLIIEEPEAHLHPEMQAEFAVQLAKLVRTGVRVLVTTHSEWILDQFANLVRLSDLPEEARSEFPHADAALEQGDFGAWLFRTQGSGEGTEVMEIKVDPEEDGLPSGYSEIAMELYNVWAAVHNRIEELSQ